MIYLSNADLSLKSGSFFKIHMEKYVIGLGRFTFGPGSVRAPMPESPGPSVTAPT